MSIEKSEKFVAVTTTYVENKGARDRTSTSGGQISFIAISGLGGEPYTVVHETEAWSGLDGPGALCARLERMPDPFDPGCGRREIAHHQHVEPHGETRQLRPLLQ